MPQTVESIQRRIRKMLVDCITVAILTLTITSGVPVSKARFSKGGSRSCRSCWPGWKAS